VQQLANRDMFNRPEWFWGNRSVPKYELARPASTDGLSVSAKKDLANDLIESFNEARKLDPENRSYSDLWASIISRSAREVVQALIGKDPTTLLSLLERLFPLPALWGIGYGDLGLSQGDRFASFVILDQLVGLGESLGVVRSECPEQGEIGYAFEGGVEKLVTDIESKLGFKIDFPKIGGSYGISIANRLIDMQTPGHIYAAYRLKSNLSRYTQATKPSVLEIGAGFGGAAYWFLQQSSPRQYVILDLALTNVYQGWFLANALGRERVSLYSDIRRDGIGHRTVSIMPTKSEHLLGDMQFDGIFNQDSFPEMPEESINGYLRLASERLRGILFSYNQEAFSPVAEKPQPWLVKQVEHVGGLTRISRERSWIRRGYVEEIYQNEKLRRDEPNA
jgi:hypothetical protein